MSKNGAAGKGFLSDVDRAALAKSVEDCIRRTAGQNDSKARLRKIVECIITEIEDQLRKPKHDKHSP